LSLTGSITVGKEDNCMRTEARSLLGWSGLKVPQVSEEPARKEARPPQLKLSDFTPGLLLRSLPKAQKEAYIL
jgi:hypothetical protein